jgi:hypothetical protein
MLTTIACCVVTGSSVCAERPHVQDAIDTSKATEIPVFTRHLKPEWIDDTCRDGVL